MKFSDIKFGLYAFVTGLSSLLLYLYNNIEANKLYNELFTDSTGLLIDREADLVVGLTKYPLIFAGVGILFGILAFINKSKFRLPGLIISIIALFLSFFPIWTIFI